MSCKSPSLVALTIAAALSACSPAATHGQFEQLLARIPASANAVALFDAERLLASPVGVREQWREKYEQSFAAGLVTMSPDTQRLVLATELDYEFMKPKWELAIADFQRARSASEIARRAKGVFERLANFPAVALRENAYAIELSSNRFAAMSPANRQSVSRWLRETHSTNSPQVSSYLEASLVASQSSPVVIAFDLEDAIPSDIIEAKLRESPAVKAAKLDLDAAGKALGSIRGLVVEVAVTEGFYGRLMIHFAYDASVLAPAAKALLQEVLADLGASIADVDEWQVEAEAKRISLHGPLSVAGRKRIFSLIDSPLAALVATDQSTSNPEDRQQTKTIAASQQYFKALSSILKDAREESKDAKTFGQNAMWFDKWARRIDKLPLLNVDQDLLNFGQYVSTQLRNMAGSMRGIGIGSSAREAQVYQTVSTDYNAYGGYGYGGYSYYTEWRNVDGERRAIRAQEKATGATSARGIAQELANTLAKVRQDMTRKYQVEF